MGVQYDPAVPFWNTLFRCSGSVIPTVVRTPMFIMELLIHLLLLGLDRFVTVEDLSGGGSTNDGGANDEEEDTVEPDEQRRMLAGAARYCGNLADVWSQDVNMGCKFLYFLDWRAIAAVTGLLTFFLVFYGSQSYGRFRFFYSHCVGLSGTAMNWTTLVRNHLPRDRLLQWNVTRLMLASMHLQYYTLNESADGAEISAKEEGVLYERELLTPLELRTIRDYGGFRPYLPLVWAQREVAAAIEASEGLPRSDEQLMHHFRELAFGARAHPRSPTSDPRLCTVPIPRRHRARVPLTPWRLRPQRPTDRSTRSSSPVGPQTSAATAGRSQTSSRSRCRSRTSTCSPCCSSLTCSVSRGPW